MTSQDLLRELVSINEQIRVLEARRADTYRALGEAAAGVGYAALHHLVMLAAGHEVFGFHGRREGLFWLVTNDCGVGCRRTSLSAALESASKQSPIGENKDGLLAMAKAAAAMPNGVVL